MKFVISVRAEKHYGKVAIRTIRWFQPLNHKAREWLWALFFIFMLIDTSVWPLSCHYMEKRHLANILGQNVRNTRRKLGQMVPVSLMRLQRRSRLCTHERDCKEQLVSQKLFPEGNQSAVAGGDMPMWNTVPHCLQEDNERCTGRVLFPISWYHECDTWLLKCYESTLVILW